MLTVLGGLCWNDQETLFQGSMKVKKHKNLFSTTSTTIYNFFRKFYKINLGMGMGNRFQLSEIK